MELFRLQKHKSDQFLKDPNHLAELYAFTRNPQFLIETETGSCMKQAFWLDVLKKCLVKSYTVIPPTLHPAKKWLNN